MMNYNDISVLNTAVPIVACFVDGIAYGRSAKFGGDLKTINVLHYMDDNKKPLTINPLTSWLCVFTTCSLAAEQ